MKNGTDVNGSLLLLHVFLGAIVGGAGYMILALVLERTVLVGVATASYGQQAGLIAMPICAMIGAVSGSALFFARHRQFGCAAAILFLLSIVGYRFVSSLWQSSVKAYGRDASDIVVYYPPLVLCGACLLGAISLLLMAGVIRMRVATS